MRCILMLLIAAPIFLFSCVKENTPEIVLDNTIDRTIAMPQNNGTFMNGPFESGSGMAIVYKQEESLVLTFGKYESFERTTIACIPLKGSSTCQFYRPRPFAVNHG